MYNGFTDIHSHIIWGIDDGAEDIHESISLCSMADRAGTGTLVMTPHLMYWEFAENLFDERNKKAEKLSEIIEDSEIELELKTGFEILCDDDIFNIKYFKPYTLCGTRYILIEFDFLKTTEDDVRSWCAYLQSFGLVPIIAHPERYAFVSDEPSCIDRLSESGVLYQINAGSPCGMFGRDARLLSTRMLERGFVDFIGSDAHMLDGRNTDMQFCFERYPDDIDERLLDIACFENPLKMMKDEQIKPHRFCYFDEK